MYTCNSCQYHSNTKLGKCPNCGEFGSFVQDTSLGNKTKTQQSHSIAKGSILKATTKSTKQAQRTIQLPEFDRVFCHKIVQGGIYLIGGAPGIGKSTAIVQILTDLITHNAHLASAYFSGEEQAQDIRARILRLTQHEAITPIFQSSCLEDVLSTIEHDGYNFVIIDSIQTIYSDHLDGSAGSVSQVRFCSDQLARFGKKHGCTICIIGHVTKGGEIAGPKYLEHIVDVVLHIEGDKLSETRFFRSYKNRFGHTADVGIFDMTAKGLVPVSNLSERILQNSFVHQTGTVLTMGIDNGRPVLVVVEVLLSKVYGKFPTKTCVGVDTKRVDIITAIAHKYCKINTDNMDIYINIPGEFKLYDSGIDLAILAAIYSQYYNKKFPANQVFLGEITLSGKITKASLHAKRKQAIPQGFHCIDGESIAFVSKLDEV